MLKTKEIHFPGTHSMKNIPKIKMGRVSKADAMVRFLISS